MKPQYKEKYSLPPLPYMSKEEELEVPPKPQINEKFRLKNPSPFREIPTPPGTAEPMWMKPVLMQSPSLTSSSEEEEDVPDTPPVPPKFFNKEFSEEFSKLPNLRRRSPPIDIPARKYRLRSNSPAFSISSGEEKLNEEHEACYSSGSEEPTSPPSRSVLNNLRPRIGVRQIPGPARV